MPIVRRNGSNRGAGEARMSSSAARAADSDEPGKNPDRAPHGPTIGVGRYSSRKNRSSPSRSSRVCSTKHPASDQQPAASASFCSAISRSTPRAFR